MDLHLDRAAVRSRDLVRIRPAVVLQREDRAAGRRIEQSLLVRLHDRQDGSLYGVRKSFPFRVVVQALARLEPKGVREPRERHVALEFRAFLPVGLYFGLELLWGRYR